VEGSTAGPVLDPAVVAFIHGGVAVGVATRDHDLKPEFARGWGPEVSADGRSLRLCVAAPEGSRVRGNLERNGAALAVGFSPPTIARAVQVKGVATVVGEPEAADLERVERHVRSFVVEAERVGAPAELSRRMFVGTGLVAVRLSIEEVFDQTPGPTAGRRL
jgi:Pyridoxamine 5'-phosphate oxidase